MLCCVELNWVKCGTFLFHSIPFIGSAVYITVRLASHYISSSEWISNGQQIDMLARSQCLAMLAMCFHKLFTLNHTQQIRWFIFNIAGSVFLLFCRILFIISPYNIAPFCLTLILFLIAIATLNVLTLLFFCVIRASFVMDARVINGCPLVKTKHVE